MRNIHRIPALALGAATLALSACAHAPVVDGRAVPTRADEHKITVTQTGERFQLAAGPNALGVAVEQMGELDRFSKMYREVGHGPLLISTPAGGANANSAARIAQEVRLRMASTGVPYGVIAGSTYDASGRLDAPVIISFSRFDAAPPSCAPVWKEDLSSHNNNDEPPGFGCFINANLGAMIADPADLISPRESEPRDSARRDVVLQKYRNGEQTHAVRTPDERIRVSDAIGDQQ
jgi:pilus assembly protein CpaD